MDDIKNLINSEENKELAEQIDFKALDALAEALMAEIDVNRSEKERFIDCVELASKQAFQNDSNNLFITISEYSRLMLNMLALNEIKHDKLCLYLLNDSDPDTFYYFSMFFRGHKYEHGTSHGGFSENYISFYAYLFD